MKKLILLVFAILIGLGVGIVVADVNSYTANVSTITPTGGDIGTGAIRVSKIVITNSDDTTAQLVTVYKHSTSTYTPTAIGYFDLGAGDQKNIVLDFGNVDMYKVTGYAVRKSTTASDIHVTTYYK
jgi:hypothetical protein